jgi:uroporphyrinogen-III decarboxylase
MNSRERVLNAIRHLPVDHAPLYLRLWSLGEGVDNFPFDWQDQIVRAENLLAFGVDDTLLLEPPLGYPEQYNADLVPGISSHVEQIEDAESGYSLLKKVYKTPEGSLTQVIRVTDDWPHGSDIPLFSDFNIPRQVEPIIKSRDDVSKLRYLLGEPSVEQMNEFCQRSASLHKEAERLGVALDGGWSALGDAAVWLCGMQNVLYWQMDCPEVLDNLLDVLLEWELRRLDLLLEEGIDVMVHMAWYEGTDFWTPRNYRRLIKPRLQQLIDRVHARHVPFRYIITKGWKPLRNDFLEMGIDCITGVDPVQDNVNLEEVKAALGADICLMGGINAAVMLTQWSDEEISDAVRRAVQVLSPGSGFILFPVDNIHCELPWEKVEYLIKQWKLYR